MNTKTYQYILVGITALWTMVFTACATSIYFQHEACVHHGAHFEANNWGLVTFHWNDECAQIILADPADSFIPPAIKK